MKLKIQSIGDRVEKGIYTLHSPFLHVANFAAGNRLVSVVSRQIGMGPVNIIIEGLDPANAEKLEVRGDSVLANNIPAPYTEKQVYDSSMDFCRGRRIPDGNIKWLKTLLAEKAPDKSMAFLLHSPRRARFNPGFEAKVRDQLQMGADLLLSGQIDRGIAKLHGCGLGLTPSGDDFIAGLLIGLHTVGDRTRPLRDEIHSYARSGSLLVSTFLDLAHEGRISELVRSLLESMLNKGQDEITNAAVKLFSVGATSGADLCTGLCMGLDRSP